MSEKKINLEEIIFNHCENEFIDGLVTFHKQHLLKSYINFGKQLLKLSTKNSEHHYANKDWVDVQSILDTIKQVE